MRGPADLDGDQLQPQNNRNYKPQVMSESREVDFSEFMWMQGDLEEFDRNVIEELFEEESSSDQYFEDMLEPDELAWYYSNVPSESQEDIRLEMDELSLSESRFVQYTNSVNSAAHGLPVITQELNPNAPIFVPGVGAGDQDTEYDYDRAHPSAERLHLLKEPETAENSTKLSSQPSGAASDSALNPDAPEFVPRKIHSPNPEVAEER